jgi:hypothetical protein
MALVEEYRDADDVGTEMELAFAFFASEAKAQ